MTHRAPTAVPGQQVEHGPYRVRSELRWDVRLPDGRRAVLGQLLPEAATEPSLRRRYVYEAERLASLDAPHLAAVLAIGPEPDPRDPTAAPPWRLRAAPDGETLEARLSRRAPMAVTEALAVVAAVADTVHEIHAAGAVLRDMTPAGVVIDDDQVAWLADVGLARVDILSTHTASSLVLEGSPYAAPEHLRATVVDVRADVYTLGVLLWRALTGTLPFGDGPALLRTQHALPALDTLTVDAPPWLDSVVGACLAEAPDDRPSSAREVAALLRGETALARDPGTTVICQACGALLRPGLRLCLSCGKVAVQFEHVDSEAKNNYTLLLVKAKEDAAFDATLRDCMSSLAETMPERLDFLIGDSRMYTKEERETLVKLPAALFTDLSRETALDLAHTMRDAGLTVKLRRTDKSERTDRRGKWFQRAGVAGMVGGVALSAVSPWFLLGLAGGVVAMITGSIMRSVAKAQRVEPLAQLRAAPAALPASDPLVARVAALLDDVTDTALRALIGELALRVQTLADHRAALADQEGQAATLAMVTEPVAPIVALIEREVGSLAAANKELATLDEAGIVRAIASSEARGEPDAKRAPLLDGLDRLRKLEDDRARHMQRLLEAASLLRQVVDMGLDVENPRALADNYTQMALAALGDGGPVE